MELPCKLRKDCTMFCLELKQEVFTISENLVTLLVTFVCLAVKFRDAAHRVQATDDFIRLLAQSCLNTYTGKCTLLMSYFPCVFFLYNAIEMLHGIFESLVKAGYIMYEFHFRRLKEALLGKGSAVENY